MALNKCYVILSWHPFFPPASPRWFFFSPIPNIELEEEKWLRENPRERRGRFGLWKGWCFCVSVVGKPNELNVSRQGEVTCYDSSCWNSLALLQRTVPTIRPHASAFSPLNQHSLDFQTREGGTRCGGKPVMFMSWAGLAQGASCAVASSTEGVRMTQHRVGYPPLAAATS